MFHLYLQILPYPCYLTQDRLKITCSQCNGCIGAHVYASSSDVDFKSTSLDDAYTCAPESFRNDVVINTK